MKMQGVSIPPSLSPAKPERSDSLSPAERMREEEERQAKTVQEVGRAEQTGESRGKKIDSLASVKQYIAENIQWKDLRFYRHEENGRIYIDITDRETGEVIKTVPETDFIKLAGQLQHTPGITIDISG